ncbi:protein translocase subunit SecDF [Psychrobacillus sp. Sa2BUA9]|uniref:Multifunctional fusion protein n=1 Tax=Psychrobacillus faecigallinarum TaxID=2762235 RepID=A0ABR8R9J4_9BACI|nr:protein translocase subunit SecDF [Psychrobacillus faecigallinarum]MBD7944384.1 protein translocase subunit SecDF [Psychrobacillus faecigallinarum]QGM30235.1 protein translocase subunit SecDF [Bacillus sp. N3536]
MKTRWRIVAFFLVIVVLGASMSTTTKGILNDIKLGLDLQGGFEVLYQVEPLKDGPKITEKDVAATANALLNRIDVLGVNEPVIEVEEGNRIRVQLAGVDDEASARKLLSTEANLTFRDADDNLMLDGNDLKEGGANDSFDQNGAPIVSLQLKDANKFAQVTQDILAKAPNNVLVIWLDFEEGVDSFKEEVSKEKPKFISAPQVSKVLNTSEVQISGSFTVEETKNLAGVLNAGALPVKLTEVYSTSVGAQFGEHALSSTVNAGIIGAVLILLFLMFYYRLPGIVANLTLVVYVYLNLLVFDWINGVLTLPGIAGLVLGIAMAVDANILTAERIREEIRIGKTVKQAFEEGTKSSWSAILDANVTSLIAAVVLFYFGTSSVKGFATILIISILVSFITAVWGSRVLLGLLIRSGYFDNKIGWFGVRNSKVHSIEENVSSLDLSTNFDRFDFVHSRRRYFTFSIIFILIGVIILSIFKLNLGIDFASGTRVEVLTNEPLTEERVLTYMENLGYPSDDIVISGDTKNIAAVRYVDEFSQDEILKLKKEMKAEFGIEPNISAVSNTVGKELIRNAIYALIYAAIGIIIYVAIRFEWRMGIASILGVLHDIILMVAIFSFTRFEVDLTFIAAVLTIVGYSINDKIVTFDRIRENLNRVKKINNENELAEIVNKSLRQTLARSVNIVLNIAFVVVSLLLFGAEAIRNFSFALFLGLLAGTYSSIYISAQLWFVIMKRSMKKKGGEIDVEQKKKQWGTDEPVV